MLPDKLKIYINHHRYLWLLSFIYITSIIGIGLVLLGYASPWLLLAGLLWSKTFQFFGHSIGMHRYFTHRAFDTSKFWHQVMCWTSVLLGTGSPISYTRNHRFHHKVVDTPQDLHSPVNDGEFKTFVGWWEFHTTPWFLNKGSVMVRDWIKDPTCKFIDKYFYKIWVALIVSSFLINWQFAVYMVLFPAFIYHVELNIFVNCVGHTWGYRNYNTRDRSKNNQWVSWWTLGEGLHNNHHAKAWLYDFATRSGEFDPSGWFIKKFMAKVNPDYPNRGYFKEDLPRGNDINEFEDTDITVQPTK